MYAFELKKLLVTEQSLFLTEKQTYFVKSKTFCAPATQGCVFLESIIPFSFFVNGYLLDSLFVSAILSVFSM